MRRPGPGNALAAALAVALATARLASAQPDPVPVPEGPPSPPVDVDHVDPDFGPLITIEDIRVVGNRTTAERIILRAVPLRQGEQLRAADPRLTKARFKVLALGYFRDVTVALEKGSARGRVIVVVTVVERGTVALNRLWYGSSELAPYWLGLDLTERNFLGTGLLVGGGLVYAGSAGNVLDARDQWGGELRLGASSLSGTRWGAHGAFQVQHGSEAVRVAGPPGSGDNADLRAFPYRRMGVRGGPSFELTPTTGFDAALRLELIDADVLTGDRVLDDGRTVPLSLDLQGGKSRVVSLAFGFDRDTRTDPVLPHEGDRIQAQVEVGAEVMGGDYDFAVALARYERWWPVRPRHAIGLRVAGGAVLGDAPRFDRIHVADVNRLLTPRVMGMTVAAAPPPDFVGTDNSDAVYGELGGNLIGEWSYRWFRRPKSIYGGDLFIAAGIWGLASEDAVKAVGARGWDAVPVDLVLDAGLRIDTELGIFEFTIANALGRVPRW
ncbi:MAG TPA: BamA/TamA family outer membrane protein [Kofleriaceae bacterium]|nr:BamA/TamA family outer membrane protein [Kofleriaceae bacterium]